MAVLVAGAVFLAALIWAILSGNPSEVLKADGGLEGFTSFDHGEIATTVDAVVWGQPTPQGGPNWIFDIFTPPVIYYNEDSGTFTVTPPFRNALPVKESFELELREISKVPFRFQLVSYAGAPGNYILTLENLDSHKDVFCVPNETLAAFGIRVLDFVEERKVAVSTREGTTEAFDFVGEVTVEDQRTGEQYSLLHNKITYLKNPLAHFAAFGGLDIVLSTGESWDSGHGRYTVRGIDSTTQSATVEKTSPDVGDKVVKILQPVKSFNSSDLSNRKTRVSDSTPGTF